MRTSAADLTPDCTVSSLEAALGTAAGNGEVDLMTLPAGCTYNLDEPLSVGADGGNLLTIAGNGATLSGQEGNFNVMLVAQNATLAVDSLTIRNGGGPETAGGAISNDGTTTFTRSAFLDNEGAVGGAIFNTPTGTLTLTNSTFSSNVGRENGGAVFNVGTVTATNVTATHNGGAGAQFASPAGTLTLKNSILYNEGPNCSGVSDGGTNIEFSSIPSCIGVGFSFADPLLTAFGNPVLNGGPTKTVALMSTSPALGAATSAGAPSTDQRGATRDSNPDIGAYEIAPFTFTPTTDVDVASPDGCTPSDCSLREAVMSANAATGEDTISVPADTYTFALDFQKENGSESGDLDLTGDVNIVGAGANTTMIDANDLDRVIEVRDGVTAEISGVTITGGNSDSHDDDDDPPAADFNCEGLAPDGDSSCGWGAGIYNTGTLTVSDAVVTSNAATGTSGVQVGTGGGITNHNGGVLTLEDSTVSANTLDGAVLGGSGVATWGGTGRATLNVIRSTISGNSGAEGIYANDSDVTITESTVSGNSNTITPLGGGITSEGGAGLTMTNSTVSGNSGNGAGGIYTTSGGTLTNVTITGNNAMGVTVTGPLLAVTNTMVANNVETGCNAFLTLTNGRNFDSDATCFYSGDVDNTDLTSVDPEILPLASNGGPTQTHALASDSQAKDAGANCPSTDQRGVTRPQGAACDIGAFELDETAPGQPSLDDTDPDSPADNNQPKIKGTAAAGSTVQLYTSSDCAPGSAIGPTSSAALFSSPGIELNVADGSTTTFYATASDTGGTSDCSTDSITYTEDSSAPGAPSVTSTTPNTTGNDTTPAVHGTSEQNATIEVFTGSSGCENSLGTASASGSGAWSYQLTAGQTLGAGTTHFWAKQTDQAGHVSVCSTSRSYVVDLTAPTVTISGPNRTTNRRPRFTFTASEASTYQCNLDNTGFQACVSPYQPASKLRIGGHTLVVRPTDTAGNVGADATKTFRVKRRRR